MVRIYVFITLLYVSASLSALLFSAAWVSELRISFLPYRMRGGMVRGILGFFWYLRRKNGAYRTLIAVTGIASFMIAGWYREVYHDYYVSHIVEQQDSVAEKKGLSFFVANIRYKNTQMQELYDSIDALNPDVILFVEYTPAHHEILYPLLHEKYPHINTEYPANGPAGKVVYAKHAFENLAPTLSGSAAWKYGYIALEYGAYEYIFYLVHTSAPVSPKFLSMRNQQLEQLVQDITAHQEATHYDSVVSIMGDFNLSRRSPAYRRLAKDRDSFENITRQFSGIHTWHALYPFLGSHIDHVWINKPHAMHHVQRIYVPGSDHHGWYGIIDYVEKETVVNENESQEE